MRLFVFDFAADPPTRLPVLTRWLPVSGTVSAVGLARKLTDPCGKWTDRGKKLPDQANSNARNHIPGTKRTENAVCCPGFRSCCCGKALRIMLMMPS
eukprot:2967306-Rhodomonas_salina.1